MTTQYEKYGRNSYVKNKQQIMSRRKARRAKNRQYIADYKKGRCCENCGIVKEHLLNFHHKDPEKKLFKISNGIDKSFNKLAMEVKKCVLLCYNCHFDLHHNLKNKEKILDKSD